MRRVDALLFLRLLPILTVVKRLTTDFAHLMIWIEYILTTNFVPEFETSKSIMLNEIIALNT